MLERNEGGVDREEVRRHWEERMEGQLQLGCKN